MSYLTPFILFVLGVFVWRQQLLAKRRYEVAEQVLAAFYKASDGLSTLRSPLILTGEIEAAKSKKKGKKQADDESLRAESEEQRQQRRRVKMHNVYVARAGTIATAFADLRTAQILAE